MKTKASKITPSRDRFGALNAVKQQQLLDTAENEFATRGFSGASLNRILLKAGMSKGQAYYYIRDKADLYCLVCERVFDRLTAAIGGWHIDDETPAAFWLSVDGLFSRVMAVCLSDIRIAEIGRSIYSSREAYQALSEPLTRLQGFLIASLERGQAFGAVRDDMPLDLLASLLFSYLSALDQWFAENMDTMEQEEVLRVNDVNRRLFREMASGKPTPA